MAQTTADDIKKMAQQQADQIVKNAELTARKATEDLSRQEFELRMKLEELKKKFTLYKSKMENFIVTQLDLLRSEEENTENDD